MRLWRLLPASVLLLLGAALSAAGAHAQPNLQGFPDPRHFDATAFGQRIELGPNWLFAPGDNPAWASPAFDDGDWITVSSEKNLFDYGIRDIHYAWYRAHLHLHPDARDLALATEGTFGSYQVFANGQSIGGNGDAPGGEFRIQSRLIAYSIPAGLLSRDGSLVIAIRFAVNPTGALGAGTSTPIGSDSGVYLLSGAGAMHEASYRDAHLAGPPIVLCALSFLIGLVALALFAALRSHAEYLAATAYLLLSSCLFFMDAWLILADRTHARDWLTYAMFGACNFATIEFVRLVLGQRRTRWLLGLEVAVVLCAFWSPLAAYAVGTFFLGFAGYFVPILIVNVVLQFLLVRALRDGNLEARVLLPAVLFEGFYRYWTFTSFLVFYLHFSRQYKPLPSLHLGTYELHLGSLSDFIFLITILLFLVFRTVGIARRNAQTAAEMEAARTVQQVLIPEEIPSVPGFSIQSVYRPYGEVGGDFFQILPTKTGGVLAIIGDVSGKGLPAAMTVSLLVGTVRTLAHFTQSPGEILAAMNLRMLGRSHGGFTTCLVLRADPNGTLTIANAGHIAPYVAGKEVPLENGLPLGLAADTAYAETAFQLAPGQQLTLMTDGVVEARGKSGALYGFDRTATLSTQPAETIVQTAQAFGQDDDITALTIALLS